MLLAGDIGGTKTDLAVFTPERGPRDPVARAEFRSANYGSLEDMAREFLAQVNLSVEHACFDVAGPVVAEHAKVTNLPWEVDAETIRKDMGLKWVHFLNDLEAVARAVPLLQPEDLHTINPGQALKGGSIGVIAPGTGLGEAFLTWDGDRYLAHASEGGHADFAPTDAVQVGLLQYLQPRYGHVSFERVCSGIGIPNIYDYLRDSGYAAELPELTQKLVAATDRTPLILEWSQHEEPSPLCKATMDMFVLILAAEASNMALKVLATGGIYLGGGIPRRVLRSFQDSRFMQVFTRKGRFKEILSRIPVHIITNTAAPLIGIANYGLELVQAEL